MKTLKNIHPGEILKEDFLDPMGISIYKLALETGLTQTRLGHIVKGNRSITAETALKLSKFFNMEAQFWLNLQNLYDLEEASKKFLKEIKKIKPMTSIEKIAI
ncbi:MAG: HigA family addiction module antitoxin [Leptospiraceae bacterium]|nr:HigA family addiction module antidote protein [Leptospiraceae bacterium]MCK6380545.1 HigA family addiction module antitoxin [Leptospiraceae bacterium]NUM41774.1 HigA family addiction module antidote protein [Leptospiraceae bacterium]